MRRPIIVVSCLLLFAATFSARAQVVPSATGRPFTLTAGALGSLFQPDYAGGGIAQASPQRLYGVGTYVDARFTHWIQIEAEARWLRYNEFLDISQDSYLIGPRLPIPHAHFWRVTPYGKVLFGFSHMNFEFNDATCRCTTIAYGGGADIKLTKRFSLRAIDVEYQQWPNWYVNQTSELHPYGASVGIGYKIF